MRLLATRRELFPGNTSVKTRRALLRKAGQGERRMKEDHSQNSSPQMSPGSRDSHMSWSSALALKSGAPGRPWSRGSWLGRFFFFFPEPLLILEDSNLSGGSGSAGERRSPDPERSASRVES